MVKKIVVVHPKCIEWELKKKDLSPEDRQAAAEALRLCNEAINDARNLVVTDDLETSKTIWGKLKRPATKGDVYLLKEDNTVFLQDCIQKGDDVEIRGAFRDICVSWAEDDCKEAGANVTISHKGTYQGRRERR